MAGQPTPPFEKALHFVVSYFRSYQYTQPERHRLKNTAEKGKGKTISSSKSETGCNQTPLHELASPSLSLCVIPREAYLSSSRLLQQWPTSIAQELHMPATFLLYPFP